MHILRSRIFTDYAWWNKQSRTNNPCSAVSLRELSYMLIVSLNLVKWESITSRKLFRERNCQRYSAINKSTTKRRRPPTYNLARKHQEWDVDKVITDGITEGKRIGQFIKERSSVMQPNVEFTSMAEGKGVRWHNLAFAVAINCMQKKPLEHLSARPEWIA